MVKSAWFSKINWGEAIKVAAMFLAVKGIDVPPEVQTAMLSVIIGIGAVYTWVTRTWFTTSLTSASVDK